jgi:glycosyltransferase involved in cell wall biosynthesis
MPTYNRAEFLPSAFASIQGQTYSDWELIIVDDGSSDDTRDVVAQYAKSMQQRVRYIYQPNQGPAAARNAGLDVVGAELIAFFDSDDEWLPHHLQDCVERLEANGDIDWVFAPTRGVTLPDRRTCFENSFYIGGQGSPFLSLGCQARKDVKVLDDPKILERALRYWFDTPLQTSVLRARVFEKLRFPPHPPVEDRLLLILALSAGFRVGYLEEIHAIYHIHSDNISLASAKPPEERFRVTWQMIRGFESLRSSLTLSKRQRRALNTHLSEEYFWCLGYPLVEFGFYDRALAEFRTAIALNPFNWRFWKTYSTVFIRKLFSKNRCPNKGLQILLDTYDGRGPQAST